MVFVGVALPAAAAAVAACGLIKSPGDQRRAAGKPESFPVAMRKFTVRLLQRPWRTDLLPASYRVTLGIVEVVGCMLPANKHLHVRTHSPHSLVHCSSVVLCRSGVLVYFLNVAGVCADANVGFTGMEGSLTYRCFVHWGGAYF